MDATALARLIELATANPAAFEALLASAKTAPAPGPQVLMAAVFDAYDKYATGAIPSWKACRQSQLPALVAFFGHKPWNEVTPELVEEFRLKRTTLGHNPGRVPAATTRNRDVRRLKAIMLWAARRGVIPTRESPIALVKDEETISRRDFHVSEEDFARLLRHCIPLLRSMLIVAFETGMRRDEFRKLERAEVDPDLRFILLPPHRHKAGRRTKKPRVIPLSSLAAEVIRRQGHTSGYVFSRPDGKPVTRFQLGHWFRAARAAAGVGGPDGQDIWIHSLRKSFGSLASLGGMPAEMVMDCAGWKDKKTFDIYRSLSRAHIDAARGHLDARLKEPQRLLAALDER